MLIKLLIMLMVMMMMMWMRMRMRRMTMTMMSMMSLVTMMTMTDKLNRCRTNMKQYWLAVSIVYQRLILVVAVIHAQRPCGRSVMNTLRKHWSSHLEALRCRDKTLQRVEQAVCSKDLLRFSTTWRCRVNMT